MKPMTFNDDTFKAILADFTDFLNGIKDAPDKINYSKAINTFLPKTETAKEKAKLIFTADAYMKMMLLTKNTTDEIGWHGIVERIDDITFKIKDILVFPQIVTTSNVDPDAEEYAKWTMELTNEQFNHMRFHGHSHVKMGVHPSGVDTKYREDMLTNLEEHDFYIFLITNYDEKRNIEIYDKSQNIVYETADILVYVCDKDGNDIMSWVKTQELSVKKRSYIPQNSISPIGIRQTGITTHTGKTTTQGTKSKKDSETKIVRAYHQDEAYWSESLGLWVYTNYFGEKKFSTTAPKTAVKNPNEEDTKNPPRQKKSQKENKDEKRTHGNTKGISAKATIKG